MYSVYYQKKVFCIWKNAIDSLLYLLLNKKIHKSSDNLVQRGGLAPDLAGRLVSDERSRYNAQKEQRSEPQIDAIDQLSASSFLR